MKKLNFFMPNKRSYRYKLDKVHGIFFLSYIMVQTAAIQFPPQPVIPLFNSSLIIESTSGDASILGKKNLKFDHNTLNF